MGELRVCVCVECSWTAVRLCVRMHIWVRGKALESLRPVTIGW